MRTSHLSHIPPKNLKSGNYVVYSTYAYYTPYKPIKMSTFTASGMEKRATKPNQIECAKEIVEIFRSKDEMYVLLRAQMQSGKTGTFHKVARVMLNRRIVDRVYIISGSNETELYSQAKEDAAAFNPDKLSQISVIFRQDFAKSTMELNRTLIIVEESHLDQNQGQQMDKFLKKHGLTLNGTTDSMRTNDTYILSVSATPFSEVSGITYNLASGKSIVDLVPGHGYRGIKLFLENDCIHETFDVNRNSQRFVDLILSHGNKWNLVRCGGRGSDGKLLQIRSAARAAGIACKFFTQDKRDIEITDLATAPVQPTIVFLKGMLRCGKVIPKSHIGLCWEDSKTPKTDTILQSLLGRMCGYYSPEMDWPQIYISPKILKADKATGLNELERYVAGMESPDNIMPTRAANLKPPKDTAIKERMPVCPIRIGPFTRSQFAAMDLPTSVSTGPRIRLEDGDYNLLDNELIQEGILRCIDEGTHAEYQPDQKAEMRQILADRPIPSLREWADGPVSHNKAHFHSAVAAYSKGEPTTERISDDASIALAIVTGSVAYPDQKFCIYVLFQLKAHGDEASLHHRVAATTRKEIFARVPVSPTSVMAMAVTITEEVLTSPEALESQLGEMIRIWKSASHVQVAPTLTAIDDQPLSFSRAAYKYRSTDDKFAAILRRLEAAHFITFTYTFSAATKYDKINFRLSSLSWKAIA